jgi:hypothetical protein
MKRLGFGVLADIINGIEKRGVPALFYLKHFFQKKIKKLLQ